VMKHFIANNQETNRNGVNAIVDERTRWQVYYPPFIAAVRAGCLQAMCAYNLVNGVHACSNPDLLLTDLKHRMGYIGAVMSDWFAVHNFPAREGLDMEMPGNSITDSANNQAYFTPKNTATLADNELKSIAKRILTGVVRYGLMEHPACSPANDGCHSQVFDVVATTDAHKELAQKMVAESVILLKNENDALPFPDGLKQIALLGSACNASNEVEAMLQQWDLGNYYTVGGSGRVIPKDPSTVLQATLAYCEQAGCHVVSELQDDVEAARVAADGADLAVICSATTSAEGRDRANLSVDQEDYVVQVATKLTIPKVSVSLIPGSVVMPWIHDVDAAVALFLAGEATGTGLLQVLSGAVNPAAKSPVTFPLTEEDAIPPCETVDCEYKEGVWAGFPTYEDKEVTFPFGHGLSYTSFSYTLQSLAHLCDGEGTGTDTLVCAEVELVNTGDRSGGEVVQLYLGFPAAAQQPKKLLRGFEKVKLGVGAATTVKLPLSKQEIATWSTEHHDWALVDGTYSLYVGSSSRDIRATAKFTVAHEKISF